MFDYVWVAILVPVTAMLSTAAVIIFALERFYRVRKLDQETKLRAIEKGYDVPVHRPKPRYPFSWPFVMVGFGFALIMIYFLGGQYDIAPLGFGLVIFFIGAGLFASRFYGVKKSEQEEELIRARTWKAPHSAQTVPPMPETGESDSDYAPKEG